MIENKIRSVDDSVCNGCPQNWEDGCTAFQMPHSEAERIHRSIPYPIMNCAVPSPKARIGLSRNPNVPTDDECMTIGFLRGDGLDDNEIHACLLTSGWSSRRIQDVLEYANGLEDPRK